MEYTVSDLLKVFLRRWYVILLSMAALTAIALFISRASYDQAVEDYDRYTNETEPVTVEVGTLTVTVPYQCGIADYDVLFQQSGELASLYENYARQLPEDVFDKNKKLDPSAYVMNAYNQMTRSFSELMTDSAVISEVNTVYAGQEEPLQPGTALTAFDHFSVSTPSANLLQIVISDLPEDTAEAAMHTYLRALSAAADTYNLVVTLEEPEADYTAAPPEYTERALFAQMTMKAPEAPPSTVRTVGMAMIFGFVFSCFGILLVTFIKDSKRVAEQGGTGSTGTGD